MIATDVDWATRAHRLANALKERGDLRTEAWHGAVASVPRHVLVPKAYQQDSQTGQWRGIDMASPEGLDLVYSLETLVTALDERNGSQYAVSSSTKPDLMVRMLELLDVDDTHRVLEIGTGTGYNAALLTQRLGDDQVFSVDVDAGLVNGARERLAEFGCHPTIAAADGEQGLPDHAPYDRIIATCSVPAVPWLWAEQLVEDGRVLVDLKLAIGAGNLVYLNRKPGRLEGRFTERWAAFMAMRHERDVVTENRPRCTDRAERTTNTPAQPWWSHRVVWFLAQFALPRGVTYGMRLDPDTRQPTAATLSSPDGSWAEVTLDEVDGAHRVAEAGITALWAAVEQAYEQWRELGEPDWPRLGLTVTPGGQQVWLDEPDGEHLWTLPTV
ncbi:methyltransferase domain-containing protein [Actinoalloteichus hymeniacidonis]|uniref:Protein-L-isoaspartate O-methyltransferase n=1 Tax=Actinoalloteichus hymeniacidonis TaxID=340345 RepID=A0AAC9HUV8_9PSEU|nr:methyltransferase domain-containing protein [Actinoalloteichus hymeniacidonis]AOS65561.1 protein-L-isoaspartate carboxylmethyltransferase [Actinoalloteichus hymeniacidonis]MBB5906349.1 protein-L-isoaspartate O-methyltransferase [Actinoalloteichus hymeniacidonis]